MSAQNKPYLPKENQKIPDFYTITVEYYDKSKREHAIIFHELVQGAKIIDIFTTDEEYKWLPLEGAKEVTFCKSFTTIKRLEAEKKAELKKQEEAKKSAEETE